MSENSPHRKSGLMVRVLSALVMLPVTIFILLQGGVGYSLFVALLAILIIYEWNGICENRAFNSLFVFQTIFVLLLIYTLSQGKYFDLYVYVTPITLLIVICLYFRMNLYFAVLGTLYALLPALSLIWLRHYSDQGGWIVLWTMIIVWSMDTGAYFAGRKIGGPKMAPRISPNKTWAGLIGGTVAAVILAVITAYYFDFRTNLIILALISALLAIVSQIGDLAESALKRYFNIKDSGAIIPGHGGIMDRVDGMVFAVPAMTLLLYLQPMEF